MPTPPLRWASGVIQRPCWLCPSAGCLGWARGQQLRAAQEQRSPVSSQWVHPPPGSQPSPRIQPDSHGAAWVQILPSLPVGQHQPSSLERQPTQLGARPWSGPARALPSCSECCPARVFSKPSDSSPPCRAGCGVSPRHPQGFCRWKEPGSWPQTWEPTVLSAASDAQTHDLRALKRWVEPGGLLRTP